MNFTVCAILLCLTGNALGYLTEDYCWRDYGGSVPQDALKVGVTKNGQSIFIGQTLAFNKLIPGNIVQTRGAVRWSAIDGSVKIFCTEEPNKFQWIKTRLNEVPKMKHRQLLEGGYEKGYTTYIGRATVENEPTIFNVVCSPRSCNKIMLKTGGYPYHDEFEILTYLSSSGTKVALASKFYISIYCTALLLVQIVKF